MFKVMSWNVENLFWPGCGQRARHKSRLSSEAPGARRHDQQSDARCPVGAGDRRPGRARRPRHAARRSRHQHISTHPDQRHIRVAWLAPHAISDPEEIVSFPEHPQAVQTDDDGTTISEMGRGAVAIRIIPDSGETICPVTTHLKSNLPTFPGGRFNTHDEAERAR